MMRLQVRIDVWNCRIRLFTEGNNLENFKDNELEVSDIVTKRDYQRAEKIVDKRGMINMSGLYGYMNVTIPKQKLLEYQIATLKTKLLNANQKLESKEKELSDTHNCL